eukprot:scaffold603234_cov27-Prasinocladus_malaysianus.AAC.1
MNDFLRWLLQKLLQPNSSSQNAPETAMPATIPIVLYIVLQPHTLMKRPTMEVQPNPCQGASASWKPTGATWPENAPDLLRLLNCVSPCRLTWLVTPPAP